MKKDCFGRYKNNEECARCSDEVEFACRVSKTAPKVEEVCTNPAKGLLELPVFLPPSFNQLNSAFQKLLEMYEQKMERGKAVEFAHDTLCALIYNGAIWSLEINKGE